MRGSILTSHCDADPDAAAAHNRGDPVQQLARRPSVGHLEGGHKKLVALLMSAALPRRILPWSAGWAVWDCISAVHACLEGSSKYADKIDLLQKLSNRLPKLHSSYRQELVAATG